MAESCVKLHIFGFGLAVGLAFAIMTFVMGLLAITGYGDVFVAALGKLYLGYDASFWGSVLGFLWGFFDGFILGVLIAFFYNFGCMKYCKR